MALRLTDRDDIVGKKFGYLTVSNFLRSVRYTYGKEKRMEVGEVLGAGSTMRLDWNGVGIWIVRT